MDLLHFLTYQRSKGQDMIGDDEYILEIVKTLTSLICKLLLNYLISFFAVYADMYDPKKQILQPSI